MNFNSLALKKVRCCSIKIIEKFRKIIYNVQTIDIEKRNDICMANEYRTHSCGELRKSNINEEVRLARICAKN